MTVGNICLKTVLYEPFFNVKTSKHVYNADLTCRTSIRQVLIRREALSHFPVLVKIKYAERSDKIIAEQSICDVSYAM